MSITTEIVSSFSNRNSGKFNEDFLINMRKNDSMVSYIDDACKAISNQLSTYSTSTGLAKYNVKYNGYYFNDNRNKELEMNQGKDDKNGKKAKSVTIHIHDTYATEAIFEFDCTCDGQTTKQRMSIWIPMLVDNSHFYIKGNKYSAPLQIIDTLTFTKRNILILKAMTRAIKFERCKETISDIYGKKYHTNSINIYANSTRKVSFLLYYFSYYGFFKTLEYFGVEKLISVYSGEIDTDVPNDKVIFKIGTKLYLAVDKEQFLNNNNVSLRTFVTSIYILQKRSITPDFLRDPVRWTVYLGDSISLNKPLEKGQSLVNTFISSYDFATNKIANQTIDDGNNRDTIFSITRWLFVNYSRLCAKDNGLQSKRVRLNEYLISPFIRRFSDNMWRFINTPVKSKNMDSLLNVFKIKSNIIINSIIGKIAPQKTGLNIAKYSSETNDNALFNSLLGCTKGGPGSPMEKTKMVSIEHRQINVDNIGNIDIIGGTSNNDPGIAGHISPFADFDMNKKVFNIDPTLLKH